MSEVVILGMNMDFGGISHPCQRLTYCWLGVRHTPTTSRLRQPCLVHSSSYVRHDVQLFHGEIEPFEKSSLYHRFQSVLYIGTGQTVWSHLIWYLCENSLGLVWNRLCHKLSFRYYSCALAFLPVPILLLNCSCCTFVHAKSVTL